MGRLHGRLRRRARALQHRGGALAHHSGRPQVVPQLGDHAAAVRGTRRARARVARGRLRRRRRAASGPLGRLESARMDLDAVEVRVLGCLVEKQRTTPDVYPLSLNALRAACNQSTNRDPVVDYDEATIRDALHRLPPRRRPRFASGARAAKYRHLLDETPGLTVEEQALLAVLMLRGPQTPGELRQRVERLYAFRDEAAFEATLGCLIERGFVARHTRRPGQKEDRYAHRLSEDLDEPAGPAPAPAPAPFAEAATPPPATSDRARLERLERQVAELTAEVAQLRAAAARNG